MLLQITIVELKQNCAGVLIAEHIYTCHFVDLISMVIVLLHGGTNLH